MKNIEIDLKVFPFDNNSFTNQPNQEDFTIRAFIDGESVAYVQCYHESGRLYAFEVLVNEEYRRQGIATKMYNFAESISGKKIHPHHENPFNHEENNVSDMALGFWKARRN